MADIQYHSTRNGKDSVSFAEAVVRGIAPDGGLYVPSRFPSIDIRDPQLREFSYRQLAEYILSLFITDFSPQELSACVRGAYDEKFRHKGIAPVHSCADAHFIELHHGRTLAFKDMALSILPLFLTTAAKKLGIEDTIVILTATSGDTGKAALEGFADVSGVKIVVFYPTRGVSDVQKRQMTTQEGENTHVVGIAGNFDDAQNGVKAIFGDGELREKISQRGYRFSSANSINPGRLLPQIVYYINGYVELVRRGEIRAGDPINVVVPTGNFGNILAAWYASQTGLPVSKFICASNRNKVLTDFIHTGRYDLDREFSPTISPSMDILVSSNLERFLYEISGRDPETVQSLMEQLKESGSYEISDTMKAGMANFYGGFADDAATVETIGELFRDCGYVVDTHTAVGYRVYRRYAEETGDPTPSLIASTASPFKFGRSVAEGLGLETEGRSDFELIDLLADYAGLEVPEPIRGIAEKPVRHPETCKKEEMKEKVEEFLA
ncbi:MAG: threonine synthase [Spirochaetaceae bacterium]